MSTNSLCYLYSKLRQHKPEESKLYLNDRRKFEFEYGSDDDSDFKDAPKPALKKLVPVGNTENGDYSSYGEKTDAMSKILRECNAVSKQSKKYGKLLEKLKKYENVSYIIENPSVTVTPSISSEELRAPSGELKDTKASPINFEEPTVQALKIKDTVLPSSGATPKLTTWPRRLCACKKIAKTPSLDNIDETNEAIYVTHFGNLDLIETIEENEECILEPIVYYYDDNLS